MQYVKRVKKEFVSLFLARRLRRRKCNLHDFCGVRLTSFNHLHSATPLRDDDQKEYRAAHSAPMEQYVRRRPDIIWTY